MGCVLRISGKDFDVDRFIQETGLEYLHVFHNGEPILQTKPDGKLFRSNGLTSNVSDADMDDLEKQLIDALKFLESNRDNLSKMSLYSEIEYAMVDFGVSLNLDKVNIRKNYELPKELLKIAGELGLSANITVYLTDGEADKL